MTEKVENFEVIDLLPTSSVEEILNNINFNTNDKKVIFNLKNNDVSKVLSDIEIIHNKEIELFSEKNTSNNQINISLKDLDTEIKTEAMKLLFSKENLIDSYAILNLYNFIKSYNTFSEEFFANSAVYINDVEEFLDIKYELKEIFEKVIYTLCLYFLSVLKSCDKINTDFDDMVVIPLLYQRLLFITDFSTMSVLLNKIQDLDISKTFVVNNANAFLDSLSLNQIIKKEVVSIIEG